MADRNVEEEKSRIRQAYQGKDFDPETICRKGEEASLDYMERLLNEKLKLIRRHGRSGNWLDVCCASGEHLVNFRNDFEYGIGIDFSVPFVERAEDRRRQKKADNILFVVGDGMQLPVRSESIDMVYSLSALYAMPDLQAAIWEIGRVLRPKGRCVLDLGNRKSLNTICAKAYPEFPQTYYIPVSRMYEFIEAGGMSVIERKAFQILPMWAARPRWMWPLLHPFWKRLFALRVGEKMLDEWVSNIPVVREFAFRQILVCEKAG